MIVEIWLVYVQRNLVLITICFWVTDIAATSIEQCRSRYDSDKMKNRRGGHYFEADFHVADCTQVGWKSITALWCPLELHFYSFTGQTEGCIQKSWL